MPKNLSTPEMEMGESVVQGYGSLSQKKKETNKLPGCQSSSVAVKQMFIMCKSRVNSPETGKEDGRKREQSVGGAH